jgi:hypothetical protein
VKEAVHQTRMHLYEHQPRLLPEPRRCHSRRSVPDMPRRDAVLPRRREFPGSAAALCRAVE